MATAYLEREGLSPDVLCNMDALETIAILVARGLGISLVPAWQGFDNAVDGVHLTRIPDAENLERQIVFLLPVTPARPKALALLWDILANVGRDKAPEEDF